MVVAHRHTLANGVRVLVGHAPHARTAAVAVFVRWGSAHESARLNGIGHVLEHMAFKGTTAHGLFGRARDARAVNLEAERLGAEVNAHTDKDHTAFYMRGLPEHADELLRQLAEIVLHPSLPAHELERERQVLLQEFAEDEDDPVATAFKLFDKACFGVHPAAQPVMGTRRNLERFTSEELHAHRAEGYRAGNLIVAAYGALDPGLVLREVERGFAAVAAGAPPPVVEPAYGGGVLTKGQDGSSQSHLVLGFAVPSRRADNPIAQVAAAVLGEGMSSPLLDRVREQRGLAYYTACSADVLDPCGQFVIEASTAPGSLLGLTSEVMALLRRHADAVPAAEIERARHQLALRALRTEERGLKWMEEAALEWFATGEVKSDAHRGERLVAVSAGDVRAFFAGLASQAPALAVTGAVARGLRHRLGEAIGRSATDAAVT